MLKVNGKDIVKEDGSKVVLRGFNLGNLALIEPNMFGTPGTEHRLRRAMKLYAGEEKTNRFFKGLNDKWATDGDFALMKELGCNSIRLPLNYRYFEDDTNPYTYLESGFALVDRILDYCKKYEMYLVIDLHAVQGSQSGDWHCDNIFGEQVNLYYDAGYQKRYYALWTAIAERYKEEEWVAGYDLMNEPVAVDRLEVAALNQIYKEVTEAIRKVDKKHILFIEGNYWAQDFSELDPPIDGNAVYSSHYYCDAATTQMDYPGQNGDKVYNLDDMRREMDKRDAYTTKYQIPNWVGEFGVRRLGNLDGKLQALKDYLTVYEERGHHWCYWNFKDLRLRGPIYLDENSAWCKFQAKIQPLKDKYHTDRSMLIGDAWDLSSVFGEYEEGDFVSDLPKVKDLLVRNMRETLGDQLTLKFAEYFAELSLEEIDNLTDSFLYENCKVYEPWLDVFKNVAKA